MDISKGVATCVMLEEVPPDLQQFSRSKEFVWWHIKPNRADLEAIATLEPDLICFEPSGGKYERAFQNFFEERNIPFLKVPGRRLKTFRDDNRLSKNDHFDGLALAAYGHLKQGEPGAFIPPTPPQIQELRRLILQRVSLNRIRTGHYNRVRLQLAGEFPEAMEFSLEATWGRPIPGIVRWLNGETTGRGPSRWEGDYNGCTRRRGGKKVEIPPTCGTGISEYTRLIAQQLYQVETAIATIEKQVETELNRPESKPYVDAMREMEFTTPIIATWLTRIYPFEKFLAPDGSERKSKKLSDRGRLVTRNHSLAQFKAALGAAIDIQGSGSKDGIAPSKSRHFKRRKKKKGDEADKIPMGCKYCRVTFWQWAMMRIETQQANSQDARKLIDHRNKLKRKGKNLFQRSGNLHGFAAKLLYKRLKDAVISS